MSYSTDQEMVAQCLDGCVSAWQQLFARVEKTITYIIRWQQWGFSSQQSEEVGQEALNSFFSALESFDFNCSLETFASTIARNKCISEIRRQAAAKRAGERFAVSAQGYDFAAGSGGGDERRLLYAENHRQLLIAFRQLEEYSRTILRLRYFEECSYKQIAEQLNIPQGTVGSRLKRSLAHLRKKVEECMNES
ncbi:MAG: sigma-70 family RNA polymerase sigma factor [Deltaproteobacteria bacterium]|nr:sigma-70 family RNA polymerase sigma factor [Deltaproteobacteria bacterium]